MVILVCGKEKKTSRLNFSLMNNRREGVMRGYRLKGLILLLLAAGAAIALVTNACAFTVTYSYDNAGRLTGAHYDSRTMILYDYDNEGNLLSREVVAVEPGDVFCDATIDLRDAIVALQAASRLNRAGVLVSGDVDGDGRIGIIEAIYILQKISGTRD